MTAEEFMMAVADDLNVAPRPLEYVSDLSGTMMGALREDMKSICIKESIRGSIDEHLVIAHEMRHIWQCENDALHEIKSREDTALYEYNEQSHEIDANAYATVVVLLCSNRIAMWQKLSDDVRIAILTRAAEMLDERELPSEPVREIVEKIQGQHIGH